MQSRMAPLALYFLCSNSFNSNTCNKWMVMSIIQTCLKFWRKKVKVTLVQALRLCTGCTAHRGSRGMTTALGVSVTPRPFFTPRKDPVPIVQEAGWAPGPVWTGAENLAPTGIRSPYCPALSQSLYRLRYPVHKILTCFRVYESL
jgi:hypothetical protein